ncbi:hypothetical protein HOY80DRAFT_626205 [Tuber brumale]|nr:hypothetical protein HOY80DRAFT_626205 [Tuber brumale]
MVSWDPMWMGTRKGLHMRIYFWSIPDGSSSSCFCCDSLLHQGPLAESPRAFLKYPSSFDVSFCSFYLFFSFSFFLFPSFLLLGLPPSYPSPPSATAFYLAAVMARAVRALLLVTTASVAAHWSGFLILFFPC